MNTFSKTGTVLLFCLIFANILAGQIWFKLDLLEDKETYQISLVSDEDWSLPNNITSTGQITVKAPTLELEITDFESLNPLLQWEYNSRFNAPNESSDFDYFSFGLEKFNRDFIYEMGEEVPILRFKNANGCSDFVSLIDNDVDPYFYSPSKTVNIGNQLTIVGARGNAYMGIKGEKMVQCKKRVIKKEHFVDDYTIFPNPATEQINLSLNWKESGQNGSVYIRDNSGKTVLVYKQRLEKGQNKFAMDISQLLGGIYYLEVLSEGGESIPMDRFVKIYSASIDQLENEPYDESPKNKSAYEKN